MTGLENRMPPPTQDKEDQIEVICSGGEAVIVDNEGHYCVHEYNAEYDEYSDEPCDVTIFFGGQPGYGSVSGHLPRKVANAVKRRGGWSHWKWDTCGC